MNFIKYGDYNFHGDSDRYGKDGLLIEGQVEQRVALFGDELTADSFTFIINSRKCAGEQTGETFNYAFLLDEDEKPIKTVDGKLVIVKNYWPDYRNFTAGTPLDLYNDPNDEIIGRFYVEDVTQVSRKSVKFTCTDAIGMLQKMEDYGGGLWEFSPIKNAGEIINEIMAGSGIQYTIQDEVADARIVGRLPRENRRVSLGKLLVAIGATVIEERGVLNFVFLGGVPQTNIPQSNIYLQGGEVRKQSPATKVQVTEHNFYQLQDDELVTLFDNSTEGIAADNQLVVFNEPCHNLKWNDGSLPAGWDYGVNYCYVTGVGTLTGRQYTHTKRLVEQSTGVNAAERVVSIDDNELINLYNASLVTRRMVNYYKLPLSIEYEQLDPYGLISAGTPVNITDPFGVFRTGWIRHKAFPLGNKTKAKMDVLVDWNGGPYGSLYSDYREFTAADISNGQLNIPADMQGKEGLIMLIGGAGGGQAGYDGEAGHHVEGTITNTRLGEPALGGVGGNGGQAGERPYVFTVQVMSLPSYYTGCAIGAGGDGGASNGALGSAGGATTLGTYSSADGDLAVKTISNIVDGRLYCQKGPFGFKGGDGGTGSGYGNVNPYSSTDGKRPDAPRFMGQVGRKADAVLYTLGAPYRTFACAGAGGGGGAYVVGSGGDGEGGNQSAQTWKAIGGKGGKGNVGDAGTTTISGGGGHGGGGGGGASAGAWQEQGGTRHDDAGTGGAGGAGGAGGKGGDGLIVIYYNA